MSRPMRISFDTQPCDKLADCQEPAEWRYSDGAQLCVYHSQERDGTLPPTIADLRAQLAAMVEAGEALSRSQDWILAGFPCKVDYEKADAAISVWIKLMADIKGGEKEKATR